MKWKIFSFLILTGLCYLFANTALDTFAINTPKKNASLRNQPFQMAVPINTSLKDGERTHGSYENNTNACASCHQTHTAAGKSLLIKSGLYATCTACHDGTLGAYNVFKPSTAGTFTGTPDGNPSTHLSNGALHIKAAPGGIIGGQFSDEEISKKGGNWLSEFTCASCHSPHGSYSDRLLHYNPNNMGNTDVKLGGNKAVLVPVVDFQPQILTIKKTVQGVPNGFDFILIRGLKSEHGISDSAIKDSDTVIALYEWKSEDGKEKYVRVRNPWLYGVNYGIVKQFWTQLYKTDFPEFTKDPQGNFKNIIDFSDKDVRFQFDKGYVYTSGEQLNEAVKGDIAQAYVVKLDKVKIDSYGKTPIYAINQAAMHQGPVDPIGSAKNDLSIEKSTSENGLQIALQLGRSMSKFCSSCHSDYLAHSGEEIGIFNSNAFRHSTDLDQFNCVRCHFAHGTDVSIMRDAKGNSVRELIANNSWTEAQANAYMLDNNPNSALKRYTNTAVCFACHANASSEQMFNNPYAQQKQFENMPDLIPYSEQN